jgi:selenide, water dikinase
VSRSMAFLNRKASEIMQGVGVNSCTDITGFGFLGHIVQMAKNSKVCLNIQANQVPYFSEAVNFSNLGLNPGGLYKNRDFYLKDVNFAINIPDYLKDILFDPQTSGGLCMSVSPRKSKRLLDSLIKAGIDSAAIVGEVTGEPAGIVKVY